MIVLDQLADTLTAALRADARRVLLGEDVREGGMLGLSRPAAAIPALREQLLATPLTPGIAIAHAGGLALGGARPVLLLASEEPLLAGVPALRELGALAALDRDVPLLIVCPCGPGFGTGGAATTDVSAWLLGIPGLRVLTCSAATAAARLRAALAPAEREEPTVLLLPRRVALAPVAEGEREPASTPTGAALGHACVTHRAGADVTLIAWGGALAPTLAAADALAASDGAAATVVEVPSLQPLDAEGLIAAARATGRVVVVHEGPGRGGAGAEVVATLADAAIWSIDAPIQRVHGTRSHTPASAESAAAPTVDMILAAARRALHP